LIRRKRDQDSASLIEEARYKEQMRQIEKDKKLKREELAAKKKIKEQIEADKRARKEKVVIPVSNPSIRVIWKTS
jgi:UBX domain-containing protein 1/4